MNATVSTDRAAALPLQVRYIDRRSIFMAIRQAQQHGNATAGQAEARALRWTIDTSERGRQTKTTREVLDTIDADTLRAAQAKGGTLPQIEVNRDRIAALLEVCEEWKQPDEVYADEAWEICIIWRSGYGSVEIGTEEDGWSRS